MNTEVRTGTKQYPKRSKGSKKSLQGTKELHKPEQGHRKHDGEQEG